jgi:hypothetical protein
MSKKVLATRFYYVDDDANSILCDVVYSDGQQVQHKVIEDTRYADVIDEDIKYGYQCEIGLMSVERPNEFVENFKKKYFGSFFYAVKAEMLNLDELK